MTTTSTDVLIIGGGPAGSTAATFLARQGLDVLVCEREYFPRFHIGESLLPYNVPLFERLGVWKRLLDHGFQRKYGAQFIFEPGGENMRLDFTRGLDRRYPMSLQVRRAELDQLLLENAAENGATVRQGCRVEQVFFDGDRALGARLRLEARPERSVQAGEGDVQEIAARVVLDASGRDTVIGKQLRIKQRDSALRQGALFAHFEGVQRPTGEQAGDILVVGGAFGWSWMIPLDEKTTSVGIVFPGGLLRQHEGDLDSFLGELIDSSPTLSKHLAEARQILPAQPAADFSYRCGRFVGDGWALLGDAAGFLDPVFSSGVYLAMRGGEYAARRVGRRLRRGASVDRAALEPYEAFARRGLDRFRRYILAYYDPACSSLFRTRPPAILNSATVSAFAGKVFEWDPRIRLFDLFFFHNSKRRRRLADRGRRTLPLAPARGA